MKKMMIRGSMIFGFSVLIASFTKGFYDRAYISGYTEGVSATVLMMKIQKQMPTPKPKPEIQIDTIFIDTLTRGHWKT